MQIKIAEHFYSIQGEGRTAGYPAIFIRLSGCNLLCGGAGTQTDGKLHNGATWTQQQKLTAADGAAFDSFGISVAISGDTVIVGADGTDINANNAQGSAYIFVQSGTTWTQQAKLTASDGTPNSFFGNSVGISGNTVIVGVRGNDIGTNINQGSTYIFVRNNTIWTQQQKLTAADGANDDSFGVSVDHDQFQHLSAWKHFHFAETDLAFECLIRAEQKLLAGLTARVKRS